MLQEAVVITVFSVPVDVRLECEWVCLHLQSFGGLGSILKNRGHACETRLLA